jgi:hypothetical protein
MASSDETRRKPGRSFIDPQKPLGDTLIEGTSAPNGDPEESVYGRVSDHPRAGHGVAERAKAVAVLRKAEELMASGNPSGETEGGRHRALELAAGRVGLKLREYERIVRGDDELRALETRVLDAAKNRDVSSDF